METPAKAPPGTRQAISVRLVGGSAALIEIGGLWLLTDPAFDALALITGGGRSPATAGGPGAAASEPGTIHAVLLSHDQHAGRPDRARSDDPDQHRDS
jgi:L-ascorbate metabolism protein UlaG (beta-lactamase superfamily)